MSSTIPPFQKKAYNTSINKVLHREHIEAEIKTFLHSFDENISDLNFKKGIYISGPSGSGKTTFIKHLLQCLNYDVISFDASDAKNKNMVESITSHNISSYNIMNLFYKQKRKNIILMDDIESMSSSGGLTSLIKLIRQKKTKRQKNELQSVHPFICIGNCFVDKKIKELMKVCHVFHLNSPTQEEMKAIIQDELKTPLPQEGMRKILELSNGDLRKCFRILRIHQVSPQWIYHNQYYPKCFNDDCKKITKTIMENPLPLSKHGEINDTERTIVSLLWHENIPDILQKAPLGFRESSVLYLSFLKNICFADYIDRITFQNQIWQFNEMSSLIKTMYNNKILHEHLQKEPIVAEIRFTKVLTKYSTEYNNFLFLASLCSKMEFDKNDLLCFFQEMKANRISPDLDLFLSLDISKLDIKRMFRFLEQNDLAFAKTDGEIDLLDPVLALATEYTQPEDEC